MFVQFILDRKSRERLRFILRISQFGNTVPVFGIFISDLFLIKVYIYTSNQILQETIT